MEQIPVEFLLNFFIYLFVPFALALIARRLKLSPIIGYLIGGVVVGNLLSGVVSHEVITPFASFGIILLFFTVGLEVNFSRIVAFKRLILIGGTLQMLISTIAIAILLFIFKFSAVQACLIGLALSGSSTSLVARLISEKKEQASFLGEVTVGILMFQDLAFIPLVIIFTSIVANTSSIVFVIRDMVFAILVSGFILWLVYYVGSLAVPRVLDRVARLSTELLNFFVIVFIFFIAYASVSLKIPILVGAFVAGILVAQTTEHRHIFSQIRPLRDILATLFFIYIGSNVVVAEAVQQLPQILLLTLLIIFVKAFIIIGIFVYLKFSSRMAFYAGIHMFQIGEASFILMLLLVSHNFVTHDQYLLVITSTLLSLILTPIIVNKKEVIYEGLRSFLRRFVPVVEQFVKHKIDLDRAPIEMLDLKQHIIICGYGRVGSQIGRALTLAHIPYIAIDYNFTLVELGKKQGINIIYGDPTDPDNLDYMQIEHATALVSAVPSKYDQEQIVLHAKRLNPRVFIISRVDSNEDHQRMRDLGVRAVVQPELEASISIIKKIFLLLGIPREDILKWLKHLKLIQGAL